MWPNFILTVGNYPMAASPEQPFPIRYPENLTLFGAALAERLTTSEIPVVTPYDLFLKVRTLRQSEQRLYVNPNSSLRGVYDRARRNLLDCKVISSDRDYRFKAFRINNNGDGPAEEICCLVDRFCYISHLSAMQRYGLTDRRPLALHLSTPRGQTLKGLIRREMLATYGSSSELLPDEAMPLLGVHHPNTVRGQRISVHHTLHPCDAVKLVGSHARIATIGQTFLETLEKPELCGGMPHVIGVWSEHAELYLEDIIDAVDAAESIIAKMRAGYILQDVADVRNDRVSGWKQYAQRGGSRVLDPAKPFAPTYSEDWMISINV